MTMHKLIAATFSTLLVLSGLAHAETNGAEQLNQFVQQVQTFQAHFEQTVIDPDGQVMEQAQGKFLLSRPGKFRWDYETPYPQKIIADGRNIWFYDIDLEQVTVKSQQESLAETPATLLSGELMPEEKYNIINLQSDDGLFWVELTPKQTDSNFQTVTLAFDGDTLSQMIMRDSFDQRTRLTFSQVTVNPNFQHDVFAFTPPPGIDVVGEVLQ
jgi:outer membrane lipoprotein carrier protein